MLNCHPNNYHLHELVLVGSPFNQSHHGIGGTKCISYMSAYFFQSYTVALSLGWWGWGILRQSLISYKSYTTCLNILYTCTVGKMIMSTVSTMWIMMINLWYMNLQWMIYPSHCLKPLSVVFNCLTSHVPAALMPARSMTFWAINDLYNKRLYIS